MNAIEVLNIIALTLLFGAALVAAPYAWNNLIPAFHPNSRLGRLERRVAGFRRALRLRFRDHEQGGYVHDTAMAQYIPPTLIHPVTGTWTYAAGQVTDTIARHVAATDETCTVNIPITVPSNSVANKGSYLVSVELDYEILVAACDAVDVVFNLVTRGADGAAATVAAQTFTYDSGHDTAAERYDVDQHRMTCTLDTPVWIDNDQYVLIELTLNKAATTTVDFLAAVANYTLRL